MFKLAAPLTALFVCFPHNLIKSSHMIRKYGFLLSMGLIAAGLALLAGYFFRPVTIDDGGKTKQIRAKAFSLSVGQALQSAGVVVEQQDVVTPPLDQPVPADGVIQIRRMQQVYLWENGRMTTLTGEDRIPANLLANEGILLDPGDRLKWNGKHINPDEPLPEGEAVVLQLERALPVMVDVDGEQQVVFTAEPDAAHALWQAGVRVGPGDRLSAPYETVWDGAPGGQGSGSPDRGASGEVDTAGRMIAYKPGRPITIQTGSQQVQARSAAETVGEALAEAGITLQGLDYSQPAENEPVPPDGKIRVVRVQEEIVLDQTLIPYETESVADPDLPLDETRTITPGKYGVKVLRERVRYEDGQEVSRQADSDWVASDPSPATIGFGTKIVPQTADTPDGQIEYYRKVQVYAFSYSPCRLGTGDGRCNWTTASGARLTKGIIATSLSWYRMFAGQRVYIPGYGFGVIADYGALRGMQIDLGFDEENFEEQAIVGWVTMYFLTPAPPNVPWTLP